MPELADGLDPDRPSRALGDQQHAQRLDVTGGGLRSSAGPARQGSSSGFDGVELIGLAVAATSLTVRPVDLDHHDARCRQVPGESGTVAAGALHSDPLHRAEGAEPARQLVITGWGSRERPDTEHATHRVDRCSDVDIEVGVHAPDDWARDFYDGHLPSLPVQLGSRGGTHVPGRRS